MPRWTVDLNSRQVSRRRHRAIDYRAICGSVAAYWRLGHKRRPYLFFAWGCAMLTAGILARSDGTALPLTHAVLTIIACAAIAGLWAVFRPDLVRDNDGRRLPPSITARLTFTILFILGYLSMAAAFLFGGFFIQSMT